MKAEYPDRSLASTFAFYRLPGEGVAYVIRPEPGGDKTFIFQDFSGRRRLSFSYRSAAVVDFQAAYRLPQPYRTFEGRRDSLDEQEYQARLNTLISLQQQGLSKKVVFSRYRFEPQLVDPFKAFEKLCTAYPEAMVYLWYHRDVGYWIGATPELLAHWECGVLTTMALAGTSVQNQASSWHTKELQEHQFVTDYILASLRAFSPTVEVGEDETVRAGALYHLRTWLRAAIPEDKIDALVRSLHPTPAVCGLPLAEAKAFIRENENYERVFYSGFLGLKSPHKTQLYVNLRCAQIYADGIRYFAGGGITRESQAAAEWLETKRKIDTLRSIL